MKIGLALGFGKPENSAMHIPDGFLDGKTAAVAAVISAAGVGFALRQVKRELPPRKMPLLGLSAAFLFAAQMVNFPVAGGTSGHLVGGTLVAALLGPGARFFLRRSGTDDCRFVDATAAETARRNFCD